MDMNNARLLGCDAATCQQALEDYLSGRALDRKPPPGPSLACWETQDGAEPIRLSFAIKVF
jgi:hypothetical protein